jgi:tRNA threonylcarbamoyladenosine biosynthesis protein TsaE
VGKTTLVRGFLRALGYTGTTRSPTYALVETYKLGPYDIHHFDLYRLNDPEELENIGIRDYFSGHAIYIIEWPERGAGVLPPADLEINMLYDGTARKIFITANSPTGRILTESLK